MSKRCMVRDALVASAGFVVAVSAPVRAQAQNSAVAPTAESDGEGLIEIVVVAQRRAEPLQDVPISITAVTAEDMQVAGVSSTISLQNAVPGLSMSVQQTSISPFIRGIGNRNTSPGDESAAALYVDGVYTSSLAASVFSLANVERIEVLKGPQGTLFGRNAAAGVIQIITREPSQTPAAEMSVTYGNYDTVVGQFYGTTGITENLSADVSVYGMNQADGWGTNVHTGNDAFKGEEKAVRSKWQLDLGDTQITLSGDYDRNEPIQQPYFRPQEGGLMLDGTGYLGFYNVNSTVDVRGVTEQWGSNLQIRHDFAAARLVSITSYRDVAVDVLFDQDGTPTRYTTAVFNQYARTATQEIQILSADDSALQWIAGAFYFHDKSAYDPLNIAGIALGSTIIDRYARQTTSSYSGFGQATIEIIDATKLTAGVRYTSDKREIQGLDLINGAPSPAGPVDQSATFDKITWRLSLDHRFGEDVLGFAQYSRGFKSGVFSAAAPTTAAVRPEVVDAYEVGLKSDLLNRRLRFNASVFYNEFRDVQLQVPVVGASVLLNAAKGDVRGAEVEIQALPIPSLQLGASLSYLDGTYTRFPTAPAFIPLPAGGATPTAIDAAGMDTIYTPPVTATLSAQYKIPAAVGDFDINGSVYYNDGFYFDPENRLRQSSYTLLNAALGWTSPDERWGLQLFGRNLGDSHYYSQVVPQRFGDTSTPDAPRTYGITLRANF